jgi:LAGLIDADG DNA endonuclease family
MVYRVDHEAASETLQGAVVGMLLGDGCVIQSHANQKWSAYFQFKHSMAQEQYALRKAEILKELTHVTIQYASYFHKERGKEYAYILVKTRCHPLYKRLREDWYSSGHRAVHPFWLQKLDRRGFAYWYFDNGNWQKARYKCYLHCQGFSWPENYMLANLIYERFGVHANVRRWVGGKPTLYIPAKSQTCLAQQVRPFATADVIYKIPDERLLASADQDGEMVFSSVGAEVSAEMTEKNH